MTVETGDSGRFVHLYDMTQFNW